MKHPNYEKLWKKFAKEHGIELKRDQAIKFAELCVRESKRRKVKKMKKEEKKQPENKNTTLTSNNKAIFLDRDGVLNLRAKEHCYVRFCSDLKRKMFPNVADNLKFIKKKGYMVIVVSNQAGINKGIIPELEYNKMIRYLTSLGVDMVYTCPHNYLKEKCDCRKPSPKMLIQAAGDWRIDLKQSWFVGDDETDMEAGIKAGCRGVFRGNLEEFVNISTWREEND